MNWQIVLSVGAGGFVGAIGRFTIAGFVQKIVGSTFPYGTLTVNILGSFIIGFLFLFFEQSIAPTQKALLVTGLLGALTTFSTFSLETVLMLQDGLLLRAVLNTTLNIVLCISATIAGMMLFRKIYGI
jgi:CrcB protein